MMSDTETKQKQCTHYWVIESPDGRTSLGKCKYCGITSEFTNDWHDALDNMNKKERPSSEEEPDEEEFLIDF
jgi:hypothetical protein